MYLTCIIPNSIYLPDSEATPDLRRCCMPLVGISCPGMDNIRSFITDEDTPLGMSLRSVDFLLELLEEGIALSNSTTEDKIDELTIPNTPDFLMRRWLKQAVAYNRVGLTDADENNPTLEAFVVVHTSLYDWD